MVWLLAGSWCSDCRRLSKTFAHVRSSECFISVYHAVVHQSSWISPFSFETQYALFDVAGAGVQAFSHLLQCSLGFFVLFVNLLGLLVSIRDTLNIIFIFPSSNQLRRVTKAYTAIFVSFRLLKLNQISISFNFFNH